VTQGPKVTVVLPTHNRVGALPRAVASVLAQDESDFELIIVDDASTDDTGTWLGGLSDQRIRIIRSDRNLGPGGARNLGLEAAIVAFLDSDDVYRTHRLSTPLAAFAQEPDAVCTLSSAVKVRRGVSDVATMPDLKLAPAAFEWALICDLVGVDTTGITVRRDLALAAGGFCAALRMTEDREFLIRLSRRGAGRLLPEILWEKSWSEDGLSMRWAEAGRGLLAYLGERPEYRARFPKLASYLTTKVLVADIRDHLWSALRRDLREFNAAGLLAGGPARLWRDHREVRSYRRRMSKPEALATLVGAPDEWV
jgi:glycosyltransferase involved in cell wall biosynthesis